LPASHRTQPLSKAGGIPAFARTSFAAWGSRRARVPLAEAPPARHIEGGRRLSAPPARDRRNLGAARNRKQDLAAALWAQALLARQPKKVVIVALANKLARIAWAIMAKGEAYRAGAIEAQAGAAA
jgi:hypothetical protein